MSEEEPDKSVKDQKSINTSRSTQSDTICSTYVPGKHGLNRASLSRPRRNPLKTSLHETRTFPASEAFLLYLWFQKFLQMNILTAEVNI